MPGIKLISELSNLPGKVFDLSPDLSLLCLVNKEDQKIYLLETKTGKSVSDYRGHYAIFSPDSSKLLIYEVSPDSLNLPTIEKKFLARLIDIGSGQIIYETSAVDRVGDENDFSVTNQYLVLKAKGGEANYLVETRSGKIYLELEASTVIFSPNGAYLVVYSRDHRTIQIIDIATKQSIIRVAGHRAIFSANSKYLAVYGVGGNTTQLYDIQSNQIILTEEGDAQGISSNGDFLAIINRAKRPLPLQVQIFQISTGKKFQFEGYKCLFSPDDKLAAISSGEITYFIELGTGEVIAQTLGHYECFSPDSQYLVTVGDISINLIESRTGRLQLPLETFYYDFTVEFSQDSKVVLVSDWGKVIRLWEVATGHKVESKTYPLLSPDGRIFIPKEHSVQIYSLD